MVRCCRNPAFALALCLAIPGPALPGQAARPLQVASVSASDTDGDHVAAHVLDGVPGTRWATGVPGATLTAALGEEAVLTALQIRWTGRPGRVYAFRLEVSRDGLAWLPVGEEHRSPAQPAGFHEVPLPSLPARLLRLHCLGNSENGWTHIDEVLIMGTGGMPAWEPPALAEADLHRVGDAAGGSGFGYYGVSPESPDATRIAYVQFAEPPTSAKSRQPAELRVCGRDLGNRRTVAHIAAAGLHNTAMPLWIDNRFIAFQSGYHETFVADADNGGIVHGPIPGQLQHTAHDGRFLVCLNREDAEPDSRGIYSVDGRTGTRRMILPTSALQPYAARIGEANLAKYVLQHVQWSTDGSHLALKVYAGQGRDWALLTLSADGSDLLWFGRKPMHFQWFDADSLFGHDSEVEDGLPNNRELRRWRRDGTVVETLAGPGCHPAMSPDREWIATEDWYGSDPVRLLLYRRGERRPTAVLATMTGAATIWGLSTHANPSFSAAGRRVYFTRTDGDAPGQAWFADLRAIADPVSRPD